MEAKTLYLFLEKDFITPELSDDWTQYMESISDYITNEFKARSMGLVCDNTPSINKVYTAVFPSNNVLSSILNSNESHLLLFVHHPSIWDIREHAGPFQLMDIDLLQHFKERHISIYNLHVPLDAYGEYSTSVSMAKVLGMEIIKPFFYYYGAQAAIYGKTQLDSINDLSTIFERVVGHRTSLYQYGTNKINSNIVAVAPGGGNILGIHEDMVKEGINTLVTGVTVKNEYSEKTHKYAEKHNINILGGTHYSTEKPACQAMCDYFNSLGLPSEFIEDVFVLEDL